MKRILTKWKTYLNEGGLTIQRHTGRGGSFSREVFRDQLSFYIGGMFQQFENIAEILEKISATEQEKQVMADDLAGMVKYYSTRGAIEYFDGEPLQVVSLDRIQKLLQALANHGFAPINPTNPKTIEEFYVMGRDLSSTRAQPLSTRTPSEEPSGSERLASTAAMSYDDLMKLQRKSQR
jgi:hypothetical protein